jgi:hypothetical protein
MVLDALYWGTPAAAFGESLKGLGSGIGANVAKQVGQSMQAPKPNVLGAMQTMGQSNVNAAATMKQQSPLKVHSANFGTFTDNAAADLRQMGLLPPTPGLSGGGYEAPRVDYAGQQNMLRNANSYLTGLADRYSNPYARGGDAYTANMNYAQSQPSGQLQNALKSTQRAAGLSGFGQNSGLVQQAQNQNRLEAAKMRAQMGGQVEADMANRSAGWQENDRNFRFQLGQAMQAGDFGAFDRLRSMENDIYGRRLDSQMDPLRVGGAQQSLLAQGLSNQGQTMQNARYGQETPYYLRGLQQGITRGDQQIQAGQYANDFTAATQPGQIDLTNANARYGTQQANIGGQAFQEQWDRYQKNRPMYDYMEQQAMMRQVQDGNMSQILGSLPPFQILRTPEGRTAAELGMQIYGRR